MRLWRVVQRLKNHFELLGLPLAYAVDPSRLESGYRQLQTQVHPDRFAAATGAERRVAMQWATRANEAYRTLRDPANLIIRLFKVSIRLSRSLRGNKPESKMVALG